MNHTDDWKALILLIAVFGCGALFGAAVSHGLTKEKWRKEIINHKCAKYVCDETTGNITFQWSTPK